MEQKSRARLRQLAAWVGAIAVITVIVWLDIATGTWNELVVLSGLAAGLVSFLLTVLVLDKVTARSAARKWAPVSRLALTEMLHALADDDQSEISQGLVVGRTLDPLEPTATLAQFDDLRRSVLSERDSLTDVLSRWSQFLTSAGENEVILGHVATIALQLDRVRDLALEAENSSAPKDVEALNAAIDQCNSGLSALEDELRGRLAALTQLEAQ